MKRILRQIFQAAGYTINRIPESHDENVYDQDGLRSIHNHGFMQDPAFCRAYQRGCCAASDYRWHWRVHIGLWAAYTANKLKGDFVECGVNRGFMSSAVMEFLEWNSCGKTFYLLDTFEGIDEEALPDDDSRSLSIAENKRNFASGFYVKGSEAVRKNFSQWRNIRIIQGSIPGTLSQVDAEHVAYLHLDMNCALPEIAALQFFWERLSNGAVVLLDDYAYHGFKAQKKAMDAFAREKEVMIASLPTGQGLLVNCRS